MKLTPVYAEIEIQAPLETVWERTQDPDDHARWDLRFSRIEYLPRASADARQRFLFTTRIGFGLKIEGEGTFVCSKQAHDGSRTTALVFWSSDPRSLVRCGSGCWRYVPTEGGVIFLTRFDYETRFGLVGAILDRIAFRPLVSWSTAWSFDRLRLWLETGILPEESRGRLLPRARRCQRIATPSMARSRRPRAAPALSSRST